MLNLHKPLLPVVHLARVGYVERGCFNYCTLTGTAAQLNQECSNSSSPVVIPKLLDTTLTLKYKHHAAGPAEYILLIHRRFYPRNLYSVQGKFHDALRSKRKSKSIDLVMLRYIKCKIVKSGMYKDQKLYTMNAALVCASNIQHETIHKAICLMM